MLIDVEWQRKNLRVNVWSDLLHFWLQASLDLVNVCHVENVDFEVNGLWNFLPPVVLLRAFYEPNWLKCEIHELVIRWGIRIDCFVSMHVT